MILKFLMRAGARIGMEDGIRDRRVRGDAPDAGSGRLSRVRPLTERVQALRKGSAYKGNPLLKARDL